MLNKKCPLCNTSNEQNFVVQLERPEDYRRCVMCGMVYSVHRPTVEEKKELYKSFDENKYYREYVENPSARPRNQKVFNQMWEFIKDCVEEHECCAEIGSSSGHFLRAALDSGHFKQALGFEFCEKVANWAIANNKVPTKHCDFELLNIRDDEYKFDVIFTSHVIEHFIDPTAQYRKFRKMLKIGGVLCMLHPDIDVPGVKFHARAEVDRSEHLNFFGLNTLNKMLAKVGGLKLIKRLEEDPGQSINVIKRLV